MDCLQVGQVCWSESSRAVRIPEGETNSVSAHLCFECVCGWERLTVVTEAVSTAGDDHGITQHLLADQTEEFFGDGMLVF